MEMLRQRLVNALEAMDRLIGEERSREGHRGTEVDRLKAKREGIALALSYTEEEIRISQEAGMSNGQ